jgi:two-component system, OmpR family, phosphate regulon sensor histidine kinase PhoR
MPPALPVDAPRRDAGGGTPARVPAYHAPMPMPSRPWRRSLTHLALWLTACAALGLAIGAFWPVLAVALALALAWNALRLYHLLRQLTGRRRFLPPEGWGVYAEIDARLYQRQAEGRQRKRRLRALLRAFRQAAAALPDGVLVVSGSELDLEWFNPAATELLGLRYPHDIGTRLPHLLRSPRVADWLHAGPREPLFDLPSPRSEEVRLSLRLIDYTPRQKLLIVRDISTLMRLEQVRRDFVANVSHELRTPLTVIHGYLDLLEPEDFPHLAPQVDEMRRQSQRMTRLVEDLLTLSRLEARDRLPSEPIPMESLLASLRREADTLSQGQHRIHVVDETGLDLLGSDRDLHSAFSNLVANAVRYTPAGGEISIRFEREGSGARFSVIDSGPGIGAEHLPRLTERFYRVSTSRSRASGGTGLGLAIVKHVLLLHQARLDIRSEVGRGSCFSAVFDASRLVARGHDDGQ